ncbi:four helix bundle protein [Catalinimonas alkaloidigena]|uniref:four helix bundle protein n=1 Tax=Catalinimonas alkaloidigena TaxID=1075417 RepID=UPI002404D071|nr:four helix bundle protein [Catalinimonas alkaloidigena]MDF9799566.1 four helix bundle protein [Catalinimonas alkaloidigena]
MAKVERFEDLRCWQMARVLVKEVYQSGSSGELGRDFGARDQIRRASISVMNNIAEGFARYHPKDFGRFLNYAQSSAAEVKSMLYLFEDLAYMEQEKIQKLHTQTDNTRKSILALIKYLSASEKKLSGMSGSRVREPRENYRTNVESYQISEEHLQPSTQKP